MSADPGALTAEPPAIVAGTSATRARVHRASTSNLRRAETRGRVQVYYGTFRLIIAAIAVIFSTSSHGLPSIFRDTENFCLRLTGSTAKSLRQHRRKYVSSRTIIVSEGKPRGSQNITCTRETIVRSTSASVDREEQKVRQTDR